MRVYDGLCMLGFATGPHFNAMLSDHQGCTCPQSHPQGSYHRVLIEFLPFGLGPGTSNVVCHHLYIPFLNNATSVFFIFVGFPLENHHFAVFGMIVGIPNLMNHPLVGAGLPSGNFSHSHQAWSIDNPWVIYPLKMVIFHRFL